MSHFEITDWADFVRDLVEESRRAEMERHLSTCSGCASTARTLGAFALAAKHELSLEPPDGLVDAAVAVFDQRGAVWEPAWDSLRWLAAQVVFDSLVQNTVAAGARAVKSGPRQFIYRAGRYSLDLHVDQETGSSEMTVVGQIGSGPDREDIVRGLPVVVLSGRKVLASSVSNDFGEFLLRFQPNRNMHLCVPVSAMGDCIDLALNAMQIREL